MNWFSNTFRRISEQETLAERRVRMVPGAVYGFIAASAYVLTLSLVNVVSYPSLHLGVDWTRLLSYWFGFGIALALAGLLVGWFTETYMGIIVGGIILTVLLLVGNLLLALVNHGGSSLAAQSVVTAVPLIGACVLLAGVLRMVINRHLHITHDEPVEKRTKLVLGLAGIIILVSFFFGFLGRYDGTTVALLRRINENMVAAQADASAASARFPVAQFPELTGHFNMDYKLYPRPSSLAAGTMDVTLAFEDGYTLTCNVPNVEVSQLYLRACNKGKYFIIP